MKPLTSEEIQAALESLPAWSADADALVRQFEFGSFREAIGAILQIGFEAEQLDHHPELLNTYNKLRVRLTTHDAGNRITERDVQLARRIEAATRN